MHVVVLGLRHSLLEALFREFELDQTLDDFVHQDLVLGCRVGRDLDELAEVVRMREIRHDLEAFARFIDETDHQF